MTFWVDVYFVTNIVIILCRILNKDGNSPPHKAAGYGGREPGARTLSWDPTNYLREIFTGTKTVLGMGLSQ